MRKVKGKANSAKSIKWTQQNTLNKVINNIYFHSPRAVYQTEKIKRTWLNIFSLLFIDVVLLFAKSISKVSKNDTGNHTNIKTCCITIKSILFDKNIILITLLL